MTDDNSTTFAVPEFLTPHPTILRHYGDIMSQSYVAPRCRVSPRVFVRWVTCKLVLGRTAFSAPLHMIRDKTTRQATSQCDNRYLPRHLCHARHTSVLRHDTPVFSYRVLSRTNVYHVVCCFRCRASRSKRDTRHSTVTGFRKFKNTFLSLYSHR